MSILHRGQSFNEVWLKRLAVGKINCCTLQKFESVIFEGLIFTGIKYRKLYIVVFIIYIFKSLFRSSVFDK